MKAAGCSGGRPGSAEPVDYASCIGSEGFDLDDAHGTLILDPSGRDLYCTADALRGRRAYHRCGRRYAGRHTPARLSSRWPASRPNRADARPGAAAAADLRLSCADGRSIAVEVLGATLPGNLGGLRVLEMPIAGGGFDGQPELQKLAWSVEQSSDAVVISDADGVIHYVNRAFEAMTGFARSEALGRTPGIVKSGHPAPTCIATCGLRCAPASSSGVCSSIARRAASCSMPRRSSTRSSARTVASPTSSRSAAT